MTASRSHFLIAATLIVFVFSFACAIAEEFEDVFKAGLDAEAAGNLDDAIRYFTEAVKIEPDSATTWNKRGELFLKKGDPKSAIADLLRAIN
jgi:tetratricopeptide (TPR) repeat protein